MSMTGTLRDLFAEYEKAFSALDVEGQAKLFTDSFVSAGPKGSIARGKKEFLEMARNATEVYRHAGFQSASIQEYLERPISESFVLVDIHWLAVFDDDAEEEVEFDVSYIVQMVEEPKVVMFITHQDESEFLKQL